MLQGVFRRVPTAGLLLLLVSSAAKAQPLMTPSGTRSENRSGQPLHDSGAGAWGDPIDYPFRPVSDFDYGLLIGGAAVGIAFQFIPPLPGHRRGGVGPDEATRDALLPRSLRSQLMARDISDGTLTLTVSQPFVDALVVAGWYRRSSELAQRMMLINAETIAVTAAVQGLIKFSASRERPYGRECGERLPSETQECDASDRFRSFTSGHASQSFASAALTCGYHARFPLYGGGRRTTSRAPGPS